jgi:SsrA-binding protein
MASRPESGIKIITENRKARYDYHLEEFYEAGLSLLGTEVKSLREGRANLTEAYCDVEKGEIWLLGAHISPYPHGGYTNHEPRRPRKLLLKKRELKRLIGRIVERGYTLIPTKLYFRRGWAKVEVALARGKKAPDKREVIKRRDQQREMERAIKEHMGRKRGYR